MRMRKISKKAGHILTVVFVIGAQLAGLTDHGLGRVFYSGYFFLFSIAVGFVTLSFYVSGSNGQPLETSYL
jgi:hypothetical protein